MTTTSETERGTDGEWSIVHRAVTRFEQALRRGERPSIAEELAGAGPMRPKLLVELVHSELDWRLKAGAPARVEEYLLAFPDLNRDRAALVDLLAAEWTIRRRSEPTLGDDEYQSRFPGLFPALLDHMTRGSTGLRTTLPLARPGDAAPDEAAMPMPAMFHRFELRDLVGQGTFGRVYRAWDTEMRQQVAIKLPRLGKSASPADVQTFLR
ncbi:MAG TPA: hypothetical protein VGH33_24180 [Isosphaeraceae bacterium]|jgi:hypothetical protein